MNPIPEMPDPNATATATLPADGAANPLVTCKLTEEEIGEWWARVNSSRDVRKNLESKWDLLLKEYLPTVTEGAMDVKAGIHFRNVHSKKAKLFYREPDLILTPDGPLKDNVTDPVTGMVFNSGDAATIKQEVLRKKLGRKGVNARRMVGECIFDILAWAGLGCSKIGYRNVTKMVPEPVMQPDPNFVPPPAPQGSMLGLNTPQAPQVPVIDPLTGQPKVNQTPVVIFEEWYWVRFSPKKLLLPDDLHSSRFDQESPWIGMEFFMPEIMARAAFQIADDVELNQSTADDLVYKHVEQKAGATKKKMVHGIEIWYKASIFDKTEVHPQAIRQLVFIEGDKSKVYVHRPSPDQTFDELGNLTPDSMIGFPIHIFSNRDVADTPWVWADSAFTNSSVKQVNTHRQQSVKLRDANIGKFLYDTSAFTPDEVDRMKRGEVGEWIAVEAGRLNNGSEKIVAALIKNEPARSDWQTAEALKQDIQETLGIGGVNAGASEDTVRTATEIQTSASALAERLEDEQDRILDDYLLGVEKFDALLQRYATESDYVRWVGKDGVQRLQMWNQKTISGRWAYTCQPDSQLRIDVARNRAQKLQFLTVTAPYANTIVNVKPIVKSLAKDFGLDPNEVIMPDQPPPPMPGQPHVPGAAAGTPGAPAASPTGSAAPPVSSPGPAGPPHAATGGLPNSPSPGAGTTQMQQGMERGGAR